MAPSHCAGPSPKRCNATLACVFRGFPAAPATVDGRFNSRVGRDSLFKRLDGLVVEQRQKGRTVLSDEFHHGGLPVVAGPK